MKKFRAVFVMFTIAFSFLSCDKEDGGNILVTVQYQGVAIDQPFIYLKEGTLTNPKIPIEQYDKSGSGDSKGQFTFENLAPGDYFIFAQGYVPGLATHRNGEASVSVKPRGRENSYKITVALK